MRLVEGLRGLKGLKDLKGLKFKVQGYWPRSTMDSIRASEAPDSGSIPDEVTFSRSLSKFIERFLFPISF